jgi:hypothetical protein
VSAGLLGVLGALVLALLSALGLWRGAARRAADEKARADGAEASAARDRKYVDKTVAIHAEAHAARVQAQQPAEDAAARAEVERRQVAAAGDDVDALAEALKRKPTAPRNVSVREGQTSWKPRP